ncbi:uncharacterized protein [Panulirus ornatus]|uniref:uncharacterized protein n=1 Tax=Panulirus ornatus TaxID=150431 RepID=UPI003A880E23
MHVPLVLLWTSILLAGVPQGSNASPHVSSSPPRPSALLPEILAFEDAMRSLEAQEEADRGSPSDQHAREEGGIMMRSFGDSFPDEGPDEDIMIPPEEKDEDGFEDVLSGVLKNSSSSSASSSSRVKRQIQTSSPWRSSTYTPPRRNSPPFCPSLTPPPSHYNKRKYLKYVVDQHVPGCVSAKCSKKCHTRHEREACVFDFDILVMRLAILESRLKELSKVEARLKIHAALLLNIRNNPGYPGEGGDRGDPGAKGHEGSKGPPGSRGNHGSCTVSRSFINPQAGPQGPPGHKGNPGPPGDKKCGCDGERGEPGPPGEDLKGRRGPRGPRGDKGSRGPSGIP